MDYITSLQQRVQQREETIIAAHNEISQVMAYLLSAKFHNDTTVQCKDVLTKLMPIKGILTLEDR